jgi:5-methylcytosine-specific restriction endonuclease McrA
VKRRFSTRTKRILLWISGGQCRSCGLKLVDGFHADHILPFARGGKTLSTNGQALCATCNLRKGSK